MPGLRIAHYLVDFGYSEPTRIYAVMQEPNGDLKMEKIVEQNGMPVEALSWWWSGLEIRRPIVLVDYHPRIAEHLKSKGIRVR